jgi:hypothetical protein
MTFLTPAAGLVALAALAVAGAYVWGHRRSEVVRRTLSLPPLGRRAGLVQPALVVAGIVLLGLAAAQPALTRTAHVRVQRDVQAIFVIDTSRSMAAASKAGARTRLDRAVAAAVRLREAIPGVESGISTLTDRVLPDLLPVADRDAFVGVAQRAVGIESPPPQSSALTATRYGALADLARGNAFAPTAARKLVVLLTDGESTPVQAGDLASALPTKDGYRFAAVRFWGPDESVFASDGKPERAYRPDASGATTLHDLAVALGGRSFEERQIPAAAAYLKRLVAGGPTHTVAATERRHLTLAPYLVLLGLAALVAGLLPSFVAPSGVRSVRQ